ncbi:MAG TPA: 50S ribosomal protein L4 [Bacteroidales bacterium]|nr:50S ribosomal protein L4 [Bacteroidales bacterium]
MELVVHKINGEVTGKKVQLPEEIFGIEPNDHAIYLDAKQYMANQRQGTHKAKERSEVSGSTRKLKRQKGTGTARSGDINSPVFVGGGRVFGPRPRNYNFKLNKKVKQLARKSALSYKFKDEQIIVLEDFNFSEPKTKNFVSLLNSFKVNGKKNLIVTASVETNLVLSARNIQGTKVMTADSLNTYEILNAGKLFLVEGSLKKFEEILA